MHENLHKETDETLHTLRRRERHTRACMQTVPVSPRSAGIVPRGAGAVAGRRRSSDCCDSSEVGGTRGLVDKTTGEMGTSMIEVPLTKGFVTVVDDQDYERVIEAGPWRVIERVRRDGSRVNEYAQRTVHRDNGTYTLQKLHRFILGVTNPRVKIDHENHNGLINTRKNLRIATQSQNSSNRRKMAAETSSKFKGVSWYKPYGKWRVQIEIAGKKKHLGYFVDELVAAETYNRAAKEIFKEFAFLNGMEAGNGK